MAKKGNNAKSKKRPQARRKAPVAQAQRNLVSMLDPHARAYMQLLRDPCGAPLCHPVYSGSDGGILSRYETDFIALNGATTTSGCIFWTPGAFGANAANASHFLVAGSPLSSSGGTVGAYTLLQTPGGSQLPVVASVVRCVAACLQVYWPGTESNRQGYIMYGNVPGRATFIGDTLSADSFGTLLQNSGRIPAGMIEIKWRPSEGDQLFIDSASDTPAAEFARRGSIGVCVKGIPVSTGVRVRAVAVYEYQPRIGQGLVQPSQSRNLSNFTFDNVMNKLDSVGNWMASYDGQRLTSAAVQMATGAVAYTGMRRAALRL